MLKSVGKYQRLCEDLLRANISRLVKIFWQILEHMRRTASKYQQMYEYLLANISRRAKIFGQISVDVRRSVVGKYQKTCEDLRANIIRRAKIYIGKYQTTCEDLCDVQRPLGNFSRHAKI